MRVRIFIMVGDAWGGGRVGGKLEGVVDAFVPKLRWGRVTVRARRVGPDLTWGD